MCTKRCWTAALTAGALCSSVALACPDAPPRGTGDLGLVVERAAGSLQLIETSGRTALARIAGLGDLSHASLVYSRDGRYAYVFGRDGGLTKVDLLCAKIERRVMQAGNSIGGAISQDGRLVATENYSPGGVKVFSAERWSCSRISRRNTRPGSSPRSSVWPMHPATASCSVCSRRARSGLRI
jgi:protein NirF